MRIRKTFQYNDFHNIFELTTGTQKAENHLSNMKLHINEDMYDVIILLWVMKDSSTFQCDSFVKGYNVYKNIWESLVGVCLKSTEEPTNEMDKTVDAVTRINSYSEEVVVGHVPKNMSKIVIMFLSLPQYALDIFVTRKRISGGGGGYGLEIPANFYFCDPEKAITWLKNKINKTEEKHKENVKHCLK